LLLLRWGKKGSKQLRAGTDDQLGSWHAASLTLHYRFYLSFSIY
jgi:hypothetical protein